jgi:hypothetical protein
MYRIPHSMMVEAVKMGFFDAAVARDHKPSSKYETTDGERLTRFSQGDETDIDEFEPMVDLADIWVASENRIYTFPVSDRRHFCIKDKPLAWMDWDDREHGPYHLLGFDDAPENVMPVSLAADLDPLDRLINNLLRKQARQAIRQKDVTLYMPEGADTAKRVQNAADGEMIQGNPAHVQVLKQGGVDPGNQAFSVGALELFNNLSGNTDALMGSGPQAETATQEEIIAAAGNRRINQMQYRVIDGVRKLMKSLGLMLWNDEFKVMAGTIQVTEGIEVDAVWRPGDREGNFLDYNFDVNPHSLVHRPPGARAAQLTQWVQGVLMPLMEPLMAQGGNIDMQALVNLYAELEGFEDLKEIITFANPVPMDKPGPTTEGAGKKPLGGPPKRYIRESVSSGGTRQGRAQSQQMAWLGAANSAQTSQAGMTP